MEKLKIKQNKYETACLFCGSTNCRGECLIGKIKKLPKEKQLEAIKKVKRYLP